MPWVSYFEIFCLVYQKGKANLDFNEAEEVSGSGISWVVCKSVPHPSHYSVSYRLKSLPAVQPTASKQ